MPTLLIKLPDIGAPKYILTDIGENWRTKNKKCILIHSDING